MAEVKQLLSVAEGIELQRIAFCDHAQGKAWNAPSTWLRVNKHHGWMKLLAGFVDSTDAMGMKVLARYPNNPPGMNLGSLLILFDPTNGFPQAIFDSIYITGVRTGAGGGLATQVCARPSSRRVGILGSGVQARFTMLAIAELCPHLEEAFVYSRSRERREAYAQWMAEATGMRFAAVDEPRTAVEDADVIVTATNSPEPVLFREWIKPGAHINAMGIKTEIAPDVFPGLRVYGDSEEVALADGKYSTAVKAGTVTGEEIAGEIGEVLVGRKPGRVDEGEITLFDSAGLAVQDVVCAQFVYEKACQQEVGVYVDLGLAEAP
jgi:ornithine cyclodeaminase/alanine dehydrogenase-like protein (mu-crystallin family)